MLVADEELGNGIEGQGALVADRPNVVEELGGDGEERQVLEVRVVVEGVAGDVVGVVVVLPPGDAEAGEAVAGDDLYEAVEGRVGGELVVAGVVANPARLDPDEADEAAGEEVGGGGGACEDAVEGDGEEEGHCEELDFGHGPDALEEARGGELHEEVAEVGGGRGDGVVGEAADKEAAEERADRGRVVGHEGVGGVLAGEGEERDLAARVVPQPGVTS